MELIKINKDHYELDGIKVTDRLSEVKELTGEVDVEKLFLKIQDDFIDEHDDIFHYYSFVKGYTQALEDNKKKKYTEEDISKALSWGYHTAKDEANGIRSLGYGTRFIQSLQPKTSWQVEFIDGKLKLK